MPPDLPRPEAPPHPPVGRPQPPAPAAGPFTLGLAGVLAGLIAAAILQSAFPLFEVPTELLPSGLPSAEQIAKADQAQFRADRLNASCAGALFGMLAGLMLGAASGVSRRSAGGAVAAGLTTAVAAGTVGGLAGYFMPWVRSLFKFPTVETDLWITAAAQAFLLGLIGLAVGAGLVLGARGTGATSGRLIGGLVGGALAGVTYPIASAVLFASGNTERPVPAEAGMRLLWLGAAGLFIGMCIGGLQRTRPTRAPDSPSGTAT